MTEDLVGVLLPENDKTAGSVGAPELFPARKFIGFVAQLRIAFLFVHEQLVELIKRIAPVSST